MQFLMGPNDTYNQPWSQLLLTPNLLNSSKVYSLLLQDEAQRSHTHPPLGNEHTTLQTSTTNAEVSTPSQAYMVHSMSSGSRPPCKHCEFWDIQRANVINFMDIHLVTTTIIKVIHMGHLHLRHTLLIFPRNQKMF